MQKELDLSIIVRTSGRSPVFIERTFRSIREQSFSPKEVIISLDGVEETSISPMLVALGSINHQIVNHLSRTNGPSASNRAIAKARGSWITFLDDDDTWQPNFIEEISKAVVSCSSNRQSVGFVTQTRCVFESFDGIKITERGARPLNSGLSAVDLAMLVVSNQFTTNSFVFSRSAYDVVGPYNENMKALDDWDFNIRFARHFDFEVIPKLLANYHQRPSSSKDGNSGRKLQITEMTRMKNSWLRADLAEGRFGLGYLSLLAEVRGLGAHVSWAAKCQQRLTSLRRFWSKRD